MDGILEVEQFSEAFPGAADSFCLVDSTSCRSSLFGFRFSIFKFRLSGSLNISCLEGLRFDRVHFTDAMDAQLLSMLWTYAFPDYPPQLQ